MLGALVLEASDSSVSDNVMADDHLFQPGRSAVTKQVGDQRATQDGNKKLCFFAEEVGFKQCTLAVGGTADREEFTRTEL